MKNCNFCLENNTLKGKVLAESEHFYFVESIDPIVTSAGMIIPRRHIETPFEFNDTEWSELKNMIVKAKEVLDTLHHPDGYNIGWNVGEIGGQVMPHVHLHVIGRFEDEPLARKGIRYALKQKENKRTK